MSRPFRQPWILAAVVCCLTAARVGAQFDLSVEQRLLEELLREGQYKQASLEAQRIQQSLKTQGGARSGPSTRTRIDLLMYREFVERLMGNLDAADKTLTEAERLFTDKDFQFWIYANVPRGEDAEKIREFWIPWSLMYFSLLDERGLLLVDRIRTANQELSVAGASLTPERQAQIIKWFKQIDELERTLMHARSTSLARLPADQDAPEGRRPGSHMMLSNARPRLIAGLRYLEASKLPFTLPADMVQTAEGPAPKPDAPVTETAQDRKAAATRQRRRAIEYLEKAGEDADAACAAALGRFESKQDPTVELAAAKAEATRIRSEVREPLVEALLLDGSLDRAREMLDPLINDLRTVEKERHPSLAKPLILSARLALEETRRSIAAKDVVQAERQAKGAIESLYEAKVLLEIEDSEFDRAAPLHAALASLIASSDDILRKSGQLVAAKDAADAAARRALQAIKASEGRRKR